MGYLILQDYYKQIQSDNLLQIINSDQANRINTELSSVEEVKSYLRQRWDCDIEFSDTEVYSKSSVYKAKRRVYLDGSTYSSGTHYVVNDIVVASGLVYICIQNAHNQTPASSPLYWTLLGNQYEFFYLITPKDDWSDLTEYAIGDEVFYKDKIYTALQGSKNIKPDNASYGLATWGSGTSYSVTGVLPSDTTKYAEGDNRNQKLVSVCVDVVLYHLHSRIAPRNIPQLRMDRYDHGILWLKKCSRGEVMTDLPLIVPDQGNRITWGSISKTNNYY